MWQSSVDVYVVYMWLGAVSSKMERQPAATHLGGQLPHVGSIKGVT